MRKGMVLVAVVLGATVLHTDVVFACPSCYGAAGGPMIDGMNMAILAMLSITGVVLAGISSFFLMMRRRIKRLRSESNNKPYVNHEGSLQWNNF